MEVASGNSDAAAIDALMAAAMIGEEQVMQILLTQ